MKQRQNNEVGCNAMERRNAVGVKVNPIATTDSYLRSVVKERDIRGLIEREEIVKRRL
jgi:hypothetical protein